MSAPAPVSPYYQPPGYGMRPRRRRRRWLAVAIGIVLVVAALVLLLIFLYPTSFGLTGSSGPGTGVFGGAFLILFLLILVFFVVRVVFWTSRAGRYGPGGGAGGGGPYGPDRPAMIARMRYARGEISKEQFDQIMKDLGRGPPPP